MGDMTPKQIIGLVAALSVTAALVVPLARSGDSKVDCSSLQRWSPSHGGYRKDELVWAKVARSANGGEFSCSDGCDGEPDKSSQWTMVGECKRQTAPH
jgi:hypothetical protein